MTDPLLRAAFCTVARNCGLSPAASRRLKAHPKADQNIRALAGTAPEYQRHVVGRLLNGDRNPFRPIASTLLVYDTVGFHEVTSRLHRAVGMVRQEAEFLRRQAAAGVRPDRLLTLDLIAEQAGALRRLLADVEVRPGTLVRPIRRQGPRAARAAVKEGLHAPGALRLLAKNVRNVAVLQLAHRPTVDEKRLALALSGEARRLAAAARDIARSVFGRADNDLRFRTHARPARRVITHGGPDGDAIAAAWLAERFLFAGDAVEVLFVPRARALGAYRRGDCLAAVRNTHDPAHRFFDRRPPGAAAGRTTCATRLVWEHLLAQGLSVQHLEPLIDAVHDGDGVRRRRGSDAYRASLETGFHRWLLDAKAQEISDGELYRRARRYLQGASTAMAT